MTYRPQTITEKGIEQHLADLHVDYRVLLFLVSAGQNDTAIAKALTKDRRVNLKDPSYRAVVAKSVKVWRNYLSATNQGDPA